MRNRHFVMKSAAWLLTFVFCYFNVLATPARAALVTTAQAVESRENAQAKAQLREFLNRDDVRAQMESWGVDPEEAQARVDTLTAQELAEAADRMDTMPAGGGGLAVVAVVLLVAFLVILLTDIMGYTNIFTFTR